ncbi:MAG TPA: DUF2325 domain-containing protein [Telmatospirillum sp.]|nr:DUF2325 domain-containing protein [Telmatospirillum sp.]
MPPIGPCLADMVDHNDALSRVSLGPRLSDAEQIALFAALDKRRTRLWELPRHFHCSIIGTCLTLAELRKIVEKLVGRAADSLSDYALHNEGVRFAGYADVAGKLLQKALDRRYQLTLKRFGRAKDGADLARLWDAAKGCGDIAGAYWAVLTHPAASESLWDAVFQDVHMVSQLAGAAHRADARRVTALEAEKADLERKLERQQAAAREALAARAATITKRNDRAAGPLVREGAPVPPPIGQDGEVLALREAVAQLQRNLSAESERCARLETLCEQERLCRSKTEAALADLSARERQLREELEIVETRLSVPNGERGETAPVPPAEEIAGTTLLYVGGRPGQVLHIRTHAEKFRVTLLHHDGGVEEKRGLLAGMVSRSEAVFFPVDCVSHDAVATLKRLCRQAGKPYHPLRSGSVTSFLAALHQLGPQMAAR